MRISELSSESGVSIATLKFYLREGMLDRGHNTTRTLAEYGLEHLERVKLIVALTNVRGLAIAKVREILAIIDGSKVDPVAAMGQAVAALPPYVSAPESDNHRAQAAARVLGFTFDPDFPATTQLEYAIEGVEHAGLEWNEAIAQRYWNALLPLASEEVAPIDTMTRQQGVVYAVLGTALYEPVILAMRRLAHRHVVERRSHLNGHTHGNDGAPS